MFYISATRRFQFNDQEYDPRGLIGNVILVSTVREMIHGDFNVTGIIFLESFIFEYHSRARKYFKFI